MVHNICFCGASKDAHYKGQIHGICEEYKRDGFKSLIAEEDEKWNASDCPCCGLKVGEHNERGKAHCLWYARTHGINLKKETGCFRCHHDLDKCLCQPRSL